MDKPLTREQADELMRLADALVMATLLRFTSAERVQINLHHQATKEYEAAQSAFTAYLTSLTDDSNG